MKQNSNQKQKQLHDQNIEYYIEIVISDLSSWKKKHYIIFDSQTSNFGIYQFDGWHAKDINGYLLCIKWILKFLSKEPIKVLETKQCKTFHNEW